MSINKNFRKALEWVKSKGFKKIKSKHEDYETPSGFHKSDKDKTLVPDITCRKQGGKYYVEIATKTEKVQQKISKWKLLSTIAERKGGELLLLAPRGHKAFTQRLMNKYGIQGKLVYLK